MSLCSHGMCQEICMRYIMGLVGTPCFEKPLQGQYSIGLHTYENFGMFYVGMMNEWHSVLALQNERKCDIDRNMNECIVMVHVL